MLHDHIDRLRAQIESCRCTQLPEEFNRNYFEAVSGSCFLDHTGLLIHPGKLCVLKGRAGIGKNAFVLNLVRNAIAPYPIAGMPDPKPEGVFYISASQKAESIAKRLLTIQTGVPQRHIEAQELTHRERSELLSACDQLREAPLLIEDRDQLTPGDRIHLAREWAVQNEAGMIVVEAPGLINPDLTGLEVKKELPLSQRLKQLTSLAEYTDVPVVLILDLGETTNSASMNLVCTIRVLAANSLTMTEEAPNQRTVQGILDLERPKLIRTHFGYKAETEQFEFLSLENLK